MQSTLVSLAVTLQTVAATPYLEWMADSVISRGVEKVFHYPQATLYKGFEAAYDLYQNETLLSWYKGQIDAIVLSNGTIKAWDYDYYSLDDYRMGNNYIWWYERTGQSKYKAAADIIRHQLDRHPRTPTGGFWHRKPVYPNQMWLDGIFMADTFYARWTNLFDNGNVTAWDDIIRQFDNIEKHTRNKTNGLLTHGYDESKSAVWADPVTGAAPLVWSRAVGWYFVALLEVLELFPKTHPGSARLATYFTTLAEGLKRAQDSSGGWWLILSEPYPGMQGNYIESSASIMFTLGFLKGIKLGLLSANEYSAAAAKAYEYLTNRFVKPNADGTINWEGTVRVGSLSSNGTYEVSVLYI
jgi:rhamnogalacturonyl hydrolase YesR